jgi:streptomycin 6-kinase
MSEPVRLQPLARARASGLGEAGREWHADLPLVLAELATRWSLTLGPSLPGGSASYLVEARTAQGEPAVVRIAMPDPGFREQVDVLVRARGRGYVRLLGHDPDHRATLLERLGPSLAVSRLDVGDQLDALAGTLSLAWRPPDRPASDRAGSLAAAIRVRHAALGGAVSTAVVEQASAYASALTVTDPADLVLVHGDPHPGNLLRVRLPRPGAETGWVFVDPAPFVADRAHDLGVAVRDFSATLLAEPASAAARLWSWCRRVAGPSGVDPRRVWAWGLLERVSTGLYVTSFGAPRVGEPFLRSAALLVEQGCPDEH